ncbi:MAG: EamA family transporter [Clostridia bacterium]|nr:EamA family transporter [Clostridia bacterium]
MKRQAQRTLAGGVTEGSGSSIGGRNFLFLHGTLLLYSAVSILAKYAAIALDAHRQAQALLFLGLEFSALLLYAFLWQRILRRMPLSFAYSNKAVCTLWICLFGLLFFGEPPTWGKALGLLAVLAGIWLVATDHDS